LVGPFDHHHRLDGNADCIYSGLCGSAIYLFDFLATVLRKISVNFLIALISILIGISLCELAARAIGLGRPLLYNSDPLVGFRLKPNQSEQRRKGALVTVDKEGFRVDPMQSGKIGEESIVFVGDSVTYGGSYINDSDLFSSLYCGDTVYYCLNNGVNAWGIYNMGRFMSNFNVYSERSPEKFILVVLPGDESRNLSSLSDTPFWGSLPVQPAGVNEILSYLMWSQVMPSLRSKHPVSGPADENKKLAISELQREIAWGDLARYISLSMYPVDVVVTPPKKWFYGKSQSEIIWYRDKLEQLKASKNVASVCNLFDFIEQGSGSPEAFYVDSAHLSVNGHKEWAVSLKRCQKVKS